MAPDKVYSLEDIKQHSSDKDCWIVVHGKVYDVTAFLEEHPGGYDIIVSTTGRDATRDFEEIGHSNQAKKLLDKYMVGTFEGGDSAPAGGGHTATKSAAAAAAAPKSAGMRMFHVILPILILIIALGLNFFYASTKQ